jgi:phage terminase large subunit-like protein
MKSHEKMRNELAHYTKGLLVGTRQDGKSTFVAEEATRFAVEHPGKHVLIINSNHYLAGYMTDMCRDALKKFDGPAATRLTQNRISLSNGSEITSINGCDQGKLCGRNPQFVAIDDIDHFMNPDDAYLSIFPLIAYAEKVLIVTSRSPRKDGHFIDMLKKSAVFDKKCIITRADLELTSEREAFLRDACGNSFETEFPAE